MKLEPGLSKTCKLEEGVLEFAEWLSVAFSKRALATPSARPSTKSMIRNASWEGMASYSNERKMQADLAHQTPSPFNTSLMTTPSPENLHYFPAYTFSGDSSATPPHSAVLR